MNLESIKNYVAEYKNSFIFAYASRLAKEGKLVEKIKVIPFEWKENFEVMYLAHLENCEDESISIRYLNCKEGLEAYLEREFVFAENYMIPAKIFDLIERSG